MFSTCLKKGVLHFNTTRIVKLNPTDPFDVTRAELEVREQAFEIYCFLKDNFESFKNCELIYTAPEIGVRESRMIDGLYTLTGQDLRACARFDDSVALGNYDIDIHNPGGRGHQSLLFSRRSILRNTVPLPCAKGYGQPACRRTLHIR